MKKFLLALLLIFAVTLTPVCLIACNDGPSGNIIVPGDKTSPSDNGTDNDGHNNDDKTTPDEDKQEPSDPSPEGQPNAWQEIKSTIKSVINGLHLSSTVNYIDVSNATHFILKAVFPDGLALDEIFTLTGAMQEEFADGDFAFEEDIFTATFKK